VGKIVHRNDDVAIIEAVGDQDQIKEVLEALDKFGIKELVRTGKLAVAS
jgi:acetolactate synthase small subunit